MRKGKGWYNEPMRHSLARKGVKTGRKSRAGSKGIRLKKSLKPYSEAKTFDIIDDLEKLKQREFELKDEIESREMKGEDSPQLDEVKDEYEDVLEQIEVKRQEFNDEGWGGVFESRRTSEIVELPEYMRLGTKKGKPSVEILVDDWRGRRIVKANRDDVRDYLRTQAGSMSGARKFAGYFGDWRPIDNMAKEVDYILSQYDKKYPVKEK